MTKMRQNLQITLFNVAVVVLFFMCLFTFVQVSYLVYSLDRPNETVVERVKEIVVTPTPTPESTASAVPSSTTKVSEKVKVVATEKPTPTPTD